ncbi:uncharacterized protein LOC132927981 [Rhopalosiphum padi]|uniref:uncharacterized protein LOC132927981 n=1 Tax=Rhopalosiphum padi TaxID=40932 RepID=UPI00298EBCA8|nr:uncharacterized protein LOC132927981 [Rhopalosiphum padi]
MASMTSLFILFALIFHIQAISNAPEVFPQTNPGQELQDSSVHVDKNKDYCPPFGSPDVQFKVKVIGTYDPPAGGCASMQPDSGDIVPAFNLWLGDLKYGIGSCEETVLDADMHHYVFKCLSKQPFVEYEYIKGWYVQLYNKGAKKNNYRCSLYKILNDELRSIKMVVSGDEWCDGLPQMLESEEDAGPNRNASIGSFGLLFTKNVVHPLPSQDVKRWSGIKDGK